MDHPMNISWAPSYQPYGYEIRMNGWNAPSGIQSYIDEHWKSFEAPNPMLHHLLATIYVFVTLASLGGNAIVAYIFTTTKDLRTPSNILILHLALIDFFMMTKTPIMIYQSFMEGPVLGVTGCTIYGIIGTISGMGNSCTNAAIAFDRYRCISNPVDGRLSKKQVLTMIAFIYLWISPWLLFPSTETWNRYVPEGYLTTCTFDYMSKDSRFFVTGIWFCAWLVPLLIIISSYYGVYCHVTLHEQKLREQAQKMNVISLRTGDKQSMRQEIRVAKVGMTLTSLFLLSWTPYAVVAFLCTYGRKELITPLMSMIPACTCKIAATIDPFVYAINHPRYRLELKKRLPWFCIHEEAPSETKSLGNETTKEVEN